MTFRRAFVYLTVILILLACGKKKKPYTMDEIAESYVKLVLEIGLYDPDFVDAYYGPDEWRPAPEKKLDAFPYQWLQDYTNGLQKRLREIDMKDFDELQIQRRAFLLKQLTAVGARIEMLGGNELDFDAEARVLYDVQPPRFDDAHFDSLLKTLDTSLPGKGDISTRLGNFKKAFIIPKDKLDTVFQTAISEARIRTLEHISLPTDENFNVEYVTEKPWSGYNWYKGNHYSLIQVNTDLPIYIDRAIDLACHEGYPGHHVYNVLLEENLMRDRGWMEFCVYPLFSPQSLIAEGSANYGIQVAFPGAERLAFEKDVLFGLAGLDVTKADRYYEILGLVDDLSYAGNEAARQYLNGDITREQAEAWLQKYALMSPERAKQRVSFIEKYRSYVINYNLGQDLVRDYIEQQGGTADHPERRWQLFEELLSEPHTASDLR